MRKKGGPGAHGAGRAGISRAGEPPNTARTTRAQDQTLADLCEQNQRRAWPIRNLGHVHRLGARATDELTIELPIRVDALSVLDELAQRFADRPILTSCERSAAMISTAAAPARQQRQRPAMTAADPRQRSRPGEGTAAAAVAASLGDKPPSRRMRIRKWTPFRP